MTRVPAFLQLVLLFTAAMHGGPVVADIRVVLSFDGDGQRVLRSAAAEPKPAKLVGRSLQAQRLKSRSVAINDGKVSLRWLDAAGEVIAIERIADPRIAHFPGSSGDSDDDYQGVQPAGRVAVPSGALLLRGPDTAQVLIVVLPAVRTPLLAAETWQLDLH